MAPMAKPGEDSYPITVALSGFSDIAVTKSPFPYFEGANYKDPLFASIVSTEVMKSYPPSLLMVSTRDYHLS